MTDAELARISLVALDSLETRFSGSFSFGLVRRALQRLEAISEGAPTEQPGADRCENCDTDLVQPATGRRRRYCSAPACQTASRRGGKTREKATMAP